MDFFFPSGSFFYLFTSSTSRVDYRNNHTYFFYCVARHTIHNNTVFDNFVIEFHRFARRSLLVVHVLYLFARPTLNIFVHWIARQALARLFAFGYHNIITPFNLLSAVRIANIVRVLISILSPAFDGVPNTNEKLAK